MSLLSIASVIEKPAEGSNITKRNGNPPSHDDYLHPYFHHARLAAILTQLNLFSFFPSFPIISIRGFDSKLHLYEEATVASGYGYFFFLTADAELSGRIFLALCYFILLSFPNYDW